MLKTNFLWTQLLYSPAPCGYVCVCVQVAVGAPYVEGSIVPSRRKPKPPPHPPLQVFFTVLNETQRRCTHEQQRPFIPITWPEKTLGSSHMFQTRWGETEEFMQTSGCTADSSHMVWFRMYTHTHTHTHTQSGNTSSLPSICPEANSVNDFFLRFAFFSIRVFLAQRKSLIWTNTRQTKVLWSWQGKEFIEGWGVVMLVVLVAVGGKEPSGAGGGQRSAACTQQLS